MSRIPFPLPGVEAAMIDSAALALGGLGGIAAAAAAAQVLPIATALPQIRVPLLPKLSGVGRPGHIALTFDDGPHQVATPRLLRILEERGVRATFFLLGRMTAGLPALAAEIAAAGHEIALHGQDHRSLVGLGPRATYRDLARSRDTVAEATGHLPTRYRPPYGRMTGSGFFAARRLGLTPVLWTAAGQDWVVGSTPESINGTIFGDLRPGGTILLHDSDVMSVSGAWRATLAAVPPLLDRCAEHGFAVGTLREHHDGPDMGVAAGSVAAAVDTPRPSEA
jgi:peptidoglycan/xylan/chitin deacetylase (PgdA/CDA1 family)